MSNVLEEIVAGVREDLAERMAGVPLDKIAAQAVEAPPTREAIRVLSGPRLSVIAEVKRSSPSKGALADIPEPAHLAHAYAAGGASAISVLTEQRRFGGSLADLDAVRAAVDLPVLRKDFVVDPYQVFEARVHGADLVLLIVAALDDRQLADLHKLALNLGLTPLVEVHTPDEARRAVDLGARLIGVNNRNLKTLEVDLAMFETIVPLLPDDAVKVAESGILLPEHAARVRVSGADAILVGEALVTNNNPRAAIADLIAAADTQDAR